MLTSRNFTSADLAHGKIFLFFFTDEKKPEERLESSQNRRLIMTRVHTQRHYSRLLLLFSSSGALHARHCLTLLLLGLTSLRTALSCDEKTRPQSRDLSALPCHAEVKRYMEQRNLDASRVVTEWMQRENEVSNMIDQSTSDVSSDDHHSSDLLKILLNRDESDPAVTKQTYDIDDDTFVSIIPNDQVHSKSTNHMKRKYDDRLNDPVKNQQVSREINFKNMRPSENNAKNWLDNLIRKQHGMPTLRATPYFLANEVVSEVQFQDDQDSDNDASLAILDGPRQSADNLLESSVHDRDTEGTLIEAPIDQLHLREASSINHLPMRSRRDRNKVDLDGVKRTDLNTDNLFTEALINRPSDRMSDLKAQRDSGESEILSERDIDVAANRRGDDSGMDRSGTVDFEDTKQTHLDSRNIYALNNRSRDRSESTVDYLFSESEDNFNVVNESTNSYAPYVDTIAINTVANNFDISTASIEDQVELDGISEIENRTEINLNTDGTEISTVDCSDSACSEASVNDNISVFRTKKYNRTKELNRKNKDYFAQVDGVSTISVNDNKTNIDVVDSEAPFTGFKGSQKFPVKINHKSRSELSQVEKFDRRHFGPRKKGIFGETPTYPSTVLLDLPKSPSRNVLQRHRKTDDSFDDGMDEESNRGEEMIEKGEKRNDTFDESWLFDVSSTGVKLSTEKLATTPNVTYGNFENVTKKDKNDSDGRVEIDVTVPSIKPIEKTNITILGLFEMTYGAVPRPEGSCELEAAKLAVERVNESGVLKRFRLRLIYNDTKVS